MSEKQPIAQPAPQEPKKPEVVLKPGLEKLQKKIAVKEDVEKKSNVQPIFVKDIKDSDYREGLLKAGPGHHPQIGFVNSNGYKSKGQPNMGLNILFPCGFKTKHFHVGTFGNVVVNKCPKCGFRNVAIDAIKGQCHNDKTGLNKDEPCDYNAIKVLEEIEDPEEV